MGRWTHLFRRCDPWRLTYTAPVRKMEKVVPARILAVLAVVLGAALAAVSPPAAGAADFAAGYPVPVALASAVGGG